MKTKTVLLLVLCGLITSGFSACEKSNDIKTSKISYGYTSGQTNYIEQVILKENVFLYDIRSMASNINKQCSTASDKDLIKEILSSANLQNFNKLPAVIGCPDCADGGAEFLEIEMDGKVHRVTYDYGKVPNELTDVVAKLKPVMLSFKDCQP